MLWSNLTTVIFFWILMYLALLRSVYSLDLTRLCCFYLRAQNRVCQNHFQGSLYIIQHKPCWRQMVANHQIWTITWNSVNKNREATCSHMFYTVCPPEGGTDKHIKMRLPVNSGMWWQNVKYVVIITYIRDFNVKLTVALSPLNPLLEPCFLNRSKIYRILMQICQQ